MYYQETTVMGSKRKIEEDNERGLEFKYEIQSKPYAGMTVT